MPQDYSPSRTLSLHWPSSAPSGLPTSGLSSFASGRQAIFALTQHLCPEQQRGQVLLPAWVPEGVYLPFVRADWQIVFYELAADAAPDWGQLQTLLTQYQFDLVVLIHYFGQQRDYQYLRTLVNGECPILEDWAHSYPGMTWRRPSAQDWALFSPTKLVGTTDGAWLIGPNSLSDHLPKGITLQSLRYVGWQLLYLLASTLLRYRLPGRALWRRLSGGSYARGYQLLVELTDQPRPVSTLGGWLLKHTQHERLVRKRIAQAVRYQKRLRNAHFHLLGDESAPSSLPWVGFPLLVDDVEQFTAYLAQHRIRGQRFTERWWFYSDAARYPTARKLWKKHFLLPINQDFNLADIDHIIDVANAYQQEG